MFRYFIHVSIFVLLQGCAALTPPPHDFVPDHVAVTSHPINAVVRSVLVTSRQATIMTTSSGVQIKGDAYTGYKDSNRRGLYEVWEDAIKTAMRTSGIFSGHGGALSLRVTLHVLDQPTFGLNAYARITAQYQLLRQVTKEIIFDEMISSESDGETGDSVIRGFRGQIALNEAVKENIKTFVESVLVASQNGRLEFPEHENRSQF